MVNVSVNGEEVRAEYSVWTLSLYEQEFKGANLIADLYGEVSLDGDRKERKGLVLDFTAQDWTMLTRVLWAGVKTADDSTPSFSAWSKGIKELDLFEVASKIPAEVMQACFRTGAGNSER